MARPEDLEGGRGITIWSFFRPWKSVDPSVAGWSVERAEAAQSYAESLGPTAVMVVQDGKPVANWGDVSRKINVASVRKSLLSALYGISVSDDRINLVSTLPDLGIDDKPPGLTATEQQATVRDQLMARSGIYHPAAHETGHMRRSRPTRRSQRTFRHQFIIPTARSRVLVESFERCANATCPAVLILSGTGGLDHLSTMRSERLSGTQASALISSMSCQRPTSIQSLPLAACVPG